MPTYQYACTECDHRFEAVQAFTDPALTECPQCGGRLRKVYSAVGVVFKGSGFYRTDSRAAPATGAAAKAGDAGGDKAATATPSGGGGAEGASGAGAKPAGPAPGSSGGAAPGGSSSAAKAGSGSAA